jgi:hypothetical protein
MKPAIPASNTVTHPKAVCRERILDDTTMAISRHGVFSQAAKRIDL